MVRAAEHMPAHVTLALSLVMALAAYGSLVGTRALAQPPAGETGPISGAEGPPVPEKAKPATGWAALPIVTYAPETEIALGGFASYFFRLGEVTAASRPSSVSVVALYTLRNQLITELMPELYWNGDRSHLWTKFDYRRYPNQLWAIGSNAPDDSEEPYTEDRFRWQLKAGQSIRGPLFIYGHLRLIEMGLEDEVPGGLLATDGIAGSDGGLSFEVGPGFAWDSRDHALAPHRGALYDFRLLTSQRGLGSDYEFTTMMLDLRQYWPVLPRHTVAAQLVFMLQDGNAPFYLIPQLGGDSLLRGYFDGRFRDKTLVAAQVEYRLPLIWRFGAVAFGGIGNVSRTLRDLGDSWPKWSVGFGLRYLLNSDEQLNLRADFGFGRDTFGVYVTAGESY